MSVYCCSCEASAKALPTRHNTAIPHQVGVAVTKQLQKHCSRSYTVNIDTYDLLQLRSHCKCIVLTSPYPRAPLAVMVVVVAVVVAATKPLQRYFSRNRRDELVGQMRLQLRSHCKSIAHINLRRVAAVSPSRCSYEATAKALLTAQLLILSR